MVIYLFTTFCVSLTAQLTFMQHILAFGEDRDVWIAQGFVGMAETPGILDLPSDIRHLLTDHLSSRDVCQLAW